MALYLLICPDGPTDKGLFTTASMGFWTKADSVTLFDRMTYGKRGSRIDHPGEKEAYKSIYCSKLRT